MLTTASIPTSVTPSRSAWRLNGGLCQTLPGVPLSSGVSALTKSTWHAGECGTSRVKYARLPPCKPASRNMFPCLLAIPAKLTPWSLRNSARTNRVSLIWARLRQKELLLGFDPGPLDGSGQTTLYRTPSVPMPGVGRTMTREPLTTSPSSAGQGSCASLREEYTPSEHCNLTTPVPSNFFAIQAVLRRCPGSRAKAYTHLCQ